VLIKPQYSLDLQLIGGVIILQTLPMVAIALYTRWFHVGGLIAGWAVGLWWGLRMLYSIPNPTTGAQHFGGTALELKKLSILHWNPFPISTVQIYPGFVALVGNLAIATVVTIALHQMQVDNGTDQTEPQDYHANKAPHDTYQRRQPIIPNTTAATPELKTSRSSGRPS
jgi:SSS family solute:Na+ symporter